MIGGVLNNGSQRHHRQRRRQRRRHPARAGHQRRDQSPRRRRARTRATRRAGPAGRSVRIEDSTIDRKQKAIDVAPTSPVNVLVNRVDMSDNCANGVVYTPARPATGQRHDPGQHDLGLRHRAQRGRPAARRG